MSETEDQLEDIDVQSEITNKVPETGTWGKKLCGVTWRIDVPVPAGEDEQSEPAQPHAVVELAFSTLDSSGKEVYSSLYFFCVLTLSFRRLSSSRLSSSSYLPGFSHRVF